MNRLIDLLWKPPASVSQVRRVMMIHAGMSQEAVYLWGSLKFAIDRVLGSQVLAERVAWIAMTYLIAQSRGYFIKSEILIGGWLCDC